MTNPKSRPADSKLGDDESTQPAPSKQDKEHARNVHTEMSADAFVGEPSAEYDMYGLLKKPDGTLSKEREVRGIDK